MRLHVSGITEHFKIESNNIVIDLIFFVIVITVFVINDNPCRIYNQCLI